VLYWDWLLKVPQPLCESKPAQSLPAQLKDTSIDMKNIFVGNLDFAATESSIRSLFEPYGNVERVNLVTDRDTGRSRGFAFVEMTDSGEADRAITALNGVNCDGRALNINEARPKTSGGGGGRPSGGGGGRPSGGGGFRQRREPRW
jgi:cold-inducible RNA-binding protein